MDNTRLQHDIATAIAKQALNVIKSCINPSLHRDFYEEAYLISRTEIAKLLRDQPYMPPTPSVN